MQSTDNASFCKVKLVPCHLVFRADDKFFYVPRFLWENDVRTMSASKPVKMSSNSQISYLYSFTFIQIVHAVVLRQTV